MVKTRKLLFLFLSTLYALALYFFYIKYVPLVKPFQILLIPILFVVFLSTAASLQRGTLLFIFFFPLINNLPYFFGIFEHTPHAPTALVLFLFYFLGWLTHHTLAREKYSLELPIFLPMALLSLLILVSGLITIFRYTNFYPLLSDHVYELTTNVHKVTAGGALMSSVFFSLNYLSGFAFFFILLNTVESKEFIRKILVVLLSSTFISLIFGFYQHFKDISLGNTPMRINESIINSTFKDPLSFGAYLSMVIPVILAAVFFFKGLIRIFSAGLFILVLFILPHTGSKSGLIGVLLSLLLFLILILLKTIDWKRLKSYPFKKVIPMVAVLAAVTAALFLLFLSSQDSEAYKRLTDIRHRYGGLEEAVGIRWFNQWKMAFSMMKNYPLTGVGIGAYIIELPNYAETHNGQYKEWVDSAENYFLQVGSEMGIAALFFSLWIFWEILKQIHRMWRRYYRYGRWKYIQIGISCGIISLVLNFFVHTYIGSYEIKYTFWLLAALLFCSSFPGEEKLHMPRWTGLSIIFLFVLFAGIHLWNSTHSLSLKSRSEKFGLKQNFGFHKKERTKDGLEFRWTRRHGGLTVKVKKPVMEIPLLASHPDIHRNPVTVKISLVKDLFEQKKILDEIVLTEHGWKTYLYHIPEEVNQELILLFEVSRTWNPQKALGTADPRNLGVALGKIQFKDRS